MRQIILATILFTLFLPAVSLGSGPTRPAAKHRPVVRGQAQGGHRVIYGGPIRYHVRSWYFSWNRPD